MKKYIKPEMHSLEIETSPVMEAGSLNSTGTQGFLGGNDVQAGASSGRAKKHALDALWDESWDDDDDEN